MRGQLPFEMQSVAGRGVKLLPLFALQISQVCVNNETKLEDNFKSNVHKASTRMAKIADIPQFPNALLKALHYVVVHYNDYKGLLGK